MPKTVADQEKDDEATREDRERLAREANQKRNDAMLARRAQIADNSDAADPEKQDLEEVTDEMLEQAAQDAEAEELEDEDEEETVRRAEAEDREQDEARDAGADDIRKNAAGITEYRLVVNGKAKWLTLAQLRATAGKVESADEYLQDASDRATRRSNPDTSPEAIEQARRQAREKAEAEHQAYKARLRDLYSKASMGDEEAIDQLAEIQAGLSRVTPDVLRIVDERVDARVEGRTSFQQAVDWFESEYKDELSTDALKTFAARRDKELAQANPTMAPKDRLRKVGDEMRQIRTDLGGKPGNARPNKLQRKRDVSQVPSAAGRQRPESDSDEPEDVRSVISGMAKARGQAGAIKH